MSLLTDRERWEREDEPAERQEAENEQARQRRAREEGADRPARVDWGAVGGLVLVCLSGWLMIWLITWVIWHAGG